MVERSNVLERDVFQKPPCTTGAWFRTNYPVVLSLHDEAFSSTFCEQQSGWQANSGELIALSGLAIFPWLDSRIAQQRYTLAIDQIEHNEPQIAFTRGSPCCT